MRLEIVGKQPFKGVKIKQIVKWINAETGEDLPETDNIFYDAECENGCGNQHVGRLKGRFLCLGCQDEAERRGWI